jgi:hypothetical protein
MPKPVVRAQTPPAELADREEGWGTFGQVRLYPSYKDDGEWPNYPISLYPSDVMHNEDLILEHPETSDGPWYRVTRTIDEEQVHYDRHSSEGEIIEDYEVLDLNSGAAW